MIPFDKMSDLKKNCQLIYFWLKEDSHLLQLYTVFNVVTGAAQLFVSANIKKKSYNIPHLLILILPVNIVNFLLNPHLLLYSKISNCGHEDILQLEEVGGDFRDWQRKENVITTCSNVYVDVVTMSRERKKENEEVISIGWLIIDGKNIQKGQT